MKQIMFTKQLTVARPPTEVQNWPGYRTGLSNLPGINLVLAHRSAKRLDIVVSLPGWGVYDEESGFYLGVHGPTRAECATNAICAFAGYTPESYAAMIKDRHVKRITAILTGGTK